jgi:hypothetical protein
MIQPICNIETREPGTWKRAQKLILCRQLLQRCCDEYGERHALKIEIDDRNFTSAFFAWLDVVTRNADYRHQNEPDYFQFAFGLLLRDLLREKAIHVKKDASTQLRPSPGNIADWWPVGYVLTHFCLGALKQTAREECAIELQDAAALSEPTVWQSFRENIVEEPGLAIAFFDKFMGLEPNWREPDRIANRPAARAGAKSG